MTLRLTGLVAATHTPFTSDGELNLACIEKQAEHLVQNGVNAAFIAGTTGESHSLSVEERLSLTTRWAEVIRGTNLKLIVHVGGNCLIDAHLLAQQAEQHGVSAISALAPSYFKPRTLSALIACCQEIAAGAPQTPFYFYDIPGMTGVSLPMVDFLAQAEQAIPTLAGIKFSNSDLMMYQKCLHFSASKYDIPWGTDEYLLSALVLGGVGAVGSSYNFAAPIYHRLMQAFASGDLTTARKEQYRSVQLIDLLARFGYMPAAKATMGFLGVDVGPARLPHDRLNRDKQSELRAQLESLGFLEWVRS